ncbi:hypothetical protein B566_EDAN007568 [Ephemera danica]|nr:hypothetical protein B566_EDAN007568 [Ephemera danica]
MTSLLVLASDDVYRRQPHVQKPQQKATENQEKRGNHGGSCPLCKERQRRRLATYIRSKSRQDSECTIEEEEEEEGKQTQEKEDPVCKRRTSN